MASQQDLNTYRQGSKSKDEALNAQAREKLLRPYLPSANLKRSHKRKLQPFRDFLRSQLHFFVYTIIHLVFSVYIALRCTYHILCDRILTVLYYHHRAPELIRKDIAGLNKVPQHLSVVLELKKESRGQVSLETLMDEVADIAAWSTCVRVPMLSVYERTGVLKHYMPSLHRAVSAKLHSYFGQDIPSLQIGAPNVSSYLNGRSLEDSSKSDAHLSMLLLSAEDGRGTLVDLAKTLAEMSQRNKLASSDITQDLVDAEIAESVMGEPDLLILFGPNVQLQGYPPWQVRLTEIYHVQDNSTVGYQIFLRALHNFAKAKFNFGR